ncbi:MAG: M16 family metallopeptidase, partial [Syntrophothermus sp.]
THYPFADYKLIVMFGCSPDMADKLTKAVFSEIEKIKKKGPTEADLQKAKETLLRTRETDLEKNNFWLSKIESVYYDQTDPASILNFNDRVNAVTIQQLQASAKKNFNLDHYVRVVLMPEKK